LRELVGGKAGGDLAPDSIKLQTHSTFQHLLLEGDDEDT
jgi:hypothetical protein